MEGELPSERGRGRRERFGEKLASFLARLKYSDQDSSVREVPRSTRRFAETVLRAELRQSTTEALRRFTEIMATTDRGQIPDWISPTGSALPPDYLAEVVRDWREAEAEGLQGFKEATAILADGLWGLDEELLWDYCTSVDTIETLLRETIERWATN